MCACSNVQSFFLFQSGERKSANYQIDIETCAHRHFFSLFRILFASTSKWWVCLDKLFTWSTSESSRVSVFVEEKCFGNCWRFLEYALSLYYDCMPFVFRQQREVTKKKEPWITFERVYWVSEIMNFSERNSLNREIQNTRTESTENPILTQLDDVWM